MCKFHITGWDMCTLHHLTTEMCLAVVLCLAVAMTCASKLFHLTAYDTRPSTTPTPPSGQCGAHCWRRYHGLPVSTMCPVS